MNIKTYKWDFFLAHAGADKDVAESLYNLLIPHSKVFLDSMCLLLGDDWDQELPEAQRNSLVTIVLVSANTGKAYYQQEEIAGAIDMSRTDKDKHRVVPVFLENLSKIGYIPYGLRLKHGLYISKKEELPTVSKSLLELLGKLNISMQQNIAGSNRGTTINSGDGLQEEEKFTDKIINPGDVTPDSAATKEIVFSTEGNTKPGANELQQPEFKPYEPANPPLPNPAYPSPYVLKCVFAGDPNTYFVTNTNLIVTVNPFGQVMTVGQRIPSMYPNFAWMYQTPYATYGVTFQGYIFTSFPNGQTMQIGYVTNPF